MRNLTFLIGSSHKGPSRVAHLNPWIIVSLQDYNNYLSTSEGRVSSINTFEPN